jgi:hypothetical protein
MRRASGSNTHVPFDGGTRRSLCAIAVKIDRCPITCTLAGLNSRTRRCQPIVPLTDAESRAGQLSEPSADCPSRTRDDDAVIPALTAGAVKEARAFASDSLLAAHAAAPAYLIIRSDPAGACSDDADQIISLRTYRAEHIGVAASPYFRR